VFQRLIPKTAPLNNQITGTIFFYCRSSSFIALLSLAPFLRTNFYLHLKTNLCFLFSHYGKSSSKLAPLLCLFKPSLNESDGGVKAEQSSG